MDGDQGAGSGNEPPGSGDQVEACSYISETLADLTAIAARHRLDTLRYLLRMARLEAEEIVQAAGRDSR